MLVCVHVVFMCVHVSSGLAQRLATLMIIVLQQQLRLYLIHTHTCAHTHKQTSNTVCAALSYKYEAPSLVDVEVQIEKNISGFETK